MIEKYSKFIVDCRGKLKSVSNKKLEHKFKMFINYKNCTLCGSKKQIKK